MKKTKSPAFIIVAALGVLACVDREGKYAEMCLLASSLGAGGGSPAKVRAS
eukprot:CAMPEP_0195102852 /NCGR_PEP_ID=MMETSP0448-20130528/69736_1 /TAXON_ID=66468 /ORGANISM="Heterocapsa triquestra, Strain CCMP 448" /LENGTH=50 /DNA_ID=CAMNT_0040138419 /DNA_START=28 /DNA_END=180 /DNA_ORIENTATION=-